MGNPGFEYLASRGITAWPAVALRWIPRAELAGAELQSAFPTRPYRDGAKRRQRAGGFPNDIAGVLRYSWWSLDKTEAAFELEGILQDGTRAEWTHPETGDTAKRISSPGKGIGAAAFIVRPPRAFGPGRLHVCEGAIDALSVDALGLAKEGDGIIGAHGCHGLPKLAPWCDRYDTLIYPHHLDAADVGEVYADKLAHLLCGRARVIRSDHDAAHDVNDELRGLAPRRCEGAAAPASITMSGAAFLELASRPPDREVVPDAPGLAYTGRAVLLHSDRGVGKTTYSAFLTARATAAGRRVLLSVDDDPASWASRLQEFGADPALFRVASMRDLAAPGALEREAAESDLVLIDSWRRWLRASTREAGKKGAANDESVVGPVADRFVEVAYGGPAVVMLTNQAKGQDGDTARGSVAIEDSVDAVRTCSKVGDLTTIRTAHKVRHGMPDGPWHLRLTVNGFTPAPSGGDGSPHLVDGDLVDPLMDRIDSDIRGYLMARPEGASMNAVKKAVRGKNMLIGQRLTGVALVGGDGLWRLPSPGADTHTLDSPGLGESPSESYPDSHWRDSPGLTESPSESPSVYRDSEDSGLGASPEGESRPVIREPAPAPETDPTPTAPTPPTPEVSTMPDPSDRQPDDLPYRPEPGPSLDWPTIEAQIRAAGYGPALDAITEDVSDPAAVWWRPTPGAPPAVGRGMVLDPHPADPLGRTTGGVLYARPLSAAELAQEVDAMHAEWIEWLTRGASPRWLFGSDLSLLPAISPPA